MRPLLRRWGWLLIACPVLAGPSAFVVSVVQPRVYEVEADVLIRPAASAPGSGTTSTTIVNDQVPQTYARLMTEPPLLDQVAKELHLPVPPVVKVTHQSGTAVLMVTVSSNRPEVARDFANRLIQDFVDWNKRYQEVQLDTYTSQLKLQIQDVQDQINATQADINKLAPPVGPRALSSDQQSQLTSLQQKAADERTHYSTLIKNLADIEAQQSLSSDTLVVVSPATLPSAPVSPRPLRDGAFGIAAGLVLAVLVIVLLNYLDQSIKTGEDLSRAGLIPLGEISSVASGRESGGELVARRAEDPVVEGYRTLRTNLLFSSVTREVKRVMVTSAMPAEGKSRTAANLAIVMAQAGYRTLLIDADLRRPSQHRHFGKVRNLGLTNLLLRQETTTGLLQVVDSVPNLFVLCSGPTPPNPSELLGSQMMAELLAELSQNFEYVIVDTPPSHGIPDALVMATRMDGTLMVVEHGRTSATAVVQTRESLSQVGAHVLGGVLNKVPVAESAYYSYRYRYGSRPAADQTPGRPGGGIPIEEPLPVGRSQG